MHNIYLRDIKLLKKMLLVTFNSEAEELTAPIINFIKDMPCVNNAAFQLNVIKKEGKLKLVHEFGSCTVVAADEQSAKDLKHDIELLSGVKKVTFSWPPSNN